MFNRLSQCAAFCVASAGMVVSSARADAPPVVLGGVTTMQDLLNPANTADFRAAGGGLYLHNNGWDDTLSSNAQKRAVLAEFPNEQTTVELGYSDPPAQWSNHFQSDYINLGVNAETVLSNGLSGKDTSGTATVAGAESYINAFKALHVPTVGIVLSPNNNATDADTYPFSSSYWDDQRTIASYGGAWATDTPPSYFFERNQGYRDWVIAETQWSNANGVKSINIISPNDAGTNFFSDSVKDVRYFEANNAIPKQWVVENYTYVNDAPANYVNQIGSEDNVNNLAYTANWLIGHVQGRPQSLDLWAQHPVNGNLNRVGVGSFSPNPSQNIALLQTTTDTRHYQISLQNLGTDSTTDFYAPQLLAQATGDLAHWSFSFTFNSNDVTNAVMHGGYTLSGTNLLEAGKIEDFTLTITRLSGAGAPFDLNLFAKANPDATIVADSLSFSDTVPEPADLGLLFVILPLLIRRRRNQPYAASMIAKKAGRAPRRLAYCGTYFSPNSLETTNI